MQEDKEIESKKPAMYRKEVGKEEEEPNEEYEAWKKLQEQMKMDFNPDEKSLDELAEHFKVS
eukprot:CAMPEP_0202976560 /NCGR_PEP_ID=MMETSP1396-20130829/78620_1 /ASSEMBLY_ACC=CAM_ASM_000872 /TAXON_ID= /ORGANISM="Pseudokeronopsis sp., Strain Brazil" /LENGTH=61 /DNA_ID=CAMNT_0049714111 /DNA_START=25 /DNA_END=210 /DNA_ORIENTATION=-